MGQEIETAGASTQLEAHSISTTWAAPKWLEAWTVVEPVPSSITSLNAEIMRGEVWLQPAPRERVVDELQRLLDMHNPPRGEAAHEANRAWWARNKADYVDALAHLPAWALERACRAARQQSEWMPKPAAILKHVRGDLADAHTALVRLRMARQVALRQAVAVKPAEEPARDVVDVTQMMDEIYAKLGTTRRKVKPED
jgi:hypothetical protein